VTYCSNYCEYNKAKREKYQVFNVNRDFHSNVLQQWDIVIDDIHTIATKVINPFSYRKYI
jgi:hypothetical protein